MVNPAVGRKRTVSRFMSHTPPSSKNNTLTVPIEGPGGPVYKSSSNWGESKILDQRTRKRINHPAKFVNEDGAKNVAKHISKAFESIFLMKSFGNDGTNFGQSRLQQSLALKPDCTQAMITLVGLKGVRIRWIYSGLSRRNENIMMTKSISQCANQLYRQGEGNSRLTILKASPTWSI